MTYNLSWAFDTAKLFRTANLFVYPRQALTWLDTVEKTGALATKIHAAKLDAKRLEEITNSKLVERSVPFQKILADLSVLVAGLKSGQIPGVPLALVDPDLARTMGAAQGWVTGEEAIQQWQESYSLKVQQEAQGTLKDMALLWMDLKGIRRRLLKLIHNEQVMVSVIYGRLFVEAGRIREYIRDSVFKGTWNRDAQALLNRYAQVFVHQMRWTNDAKALNVQLEEILDEFRNVSGTQGRVFREIVETAIRVGGGMAA
jgi:hypothetical protein